MSSKAILVVGASRGIGLELVNQLSQNSENIVFAGLRKMPNIALYDGSHSNIKVVHLEQTSTSSITTAASQIPELDTLILNAAIGEDDHLMSITPERLSQYLDTNVVGSLRITQAFLPALKARKTRHIIYVSSSAGSLAGQRQTSWGLQGPYAVTKAAGNMMAVQLDNELGSQGFTVISVHPGWVNTDMGRLGGDGGMPVEDSVKYLIDLEQKLTVVDGGKFLNYDGTELPY
jgi:NAD(P)-dependent dehydrogenase (short-subunit alcohol dehydrogenase family)